MQITDAQQRIIEGIVATCGETDDLVDIAPHIDGIIAQLRGLIAERPDLVAFARSIQTTASARAILDWSSDRVPSISDSGWNELAERVTALIGR